MKITRRKLRLLLNEIISKDPDEEENSRAAIAGSPRSEDYGNWVDKLSSILGVGSIENIPDITTYDAYQAMLSPEQYSFILGNDPSYDDDQMKTSPVSGDSDEDWIYDLEGEMEAKMQGIESGDVVDLDDRR